MGVILVGHLHRLAGFAGLDSGENGGGDVASAPSIEDRFASGVECAGEVVHQ